MGYLVSYYFNMLITNVVNYLLHNPDFVIFATFNLLGIFISLIVYVIIRIK